MILQLQISGEQKLILILETFFHLRSGRDDVLRNVLKSRPEFHNLEIDTTLKALQALEALGKCVIVHGDSEDALVSYLTLYKLVRRPLITWH